MAAKKTEGISASLPFAALQLLAPPVRLVSAALWKVMKQRDVTQYGVLEEFVTSACETVPGLLTARHQGKLALGLRGRYILELCSTQLDEKVIMPNLERIRAPAGLSLSTAATLKRDVKIVKTVESFHSLVHTLITDAAEREHFFKEEFPVDYGPAFDQELEKLLWEFLIRLDQLLPVPNLSQTVSWLSDAPPVLEECAQAATQPQLLKILLQHQTCLGHLETAASLPPNMGDSILDSLSLPLSGRVPSKQITGAKSAPGGTQTHHKTPFTTPVFGFMSTKDVPVMMSANKRTLGGEGPASSKDELSKFTVVKQMEEEEEEEEEEKRGVGVKRKLDVKTLHLPDDASTRSALVLCMSSRPRVVVEKLPDSVAYTTSRGGKSSNVTTRSQRRKSPVNAPTCKNLSSHPVKPDLDYPGPGDKENHPVKSESSSPSRQRSTTESAALSGDADDFVADSEDEATKNFKVRLFMKRYYKTKHGTYVPTLREYRKPGMTQRRLSLSPRKRR
nr:uncharacterized protein LOC109988732 [Labrus bergylta]